MAPPFMPSLMYQPIDSQIYHLLQHYCYSVKFPALAINFLSLLYLFASKPGKIFTLDSIDGFLITSSSAVRSEFNHSPFTIMAKIKQIFNYFEIFKTRLTSKQMKYIGSLLMLDLLVFVYSKVSPKPFYHMFKNRWHTLLPLLLNLHLLICSTKVRFLVQCTLFISLSNFPNTFPNY